MTPLINSPLSALETCRIQALAKTIGRTPLDELQAQVNVMLSPDGQDVFDLLLDKMKLKPLAADRFMAEKMEKVRLAAYCHRWLCSFPSLAKPKA